MEAGECRQLPKIWPHTASKEIDCQVQQTVLVFLFCTRLALHGEYYLHLKCAQQLQVMH